MARTVTLLQLRNDARLYADNRSSSTVNGHISDAELTRLINLQLSELHETLVAARGNDYAGTLAEADVALTAGTSAYDLPEDFFQLVACEIARSDTDHEVIENLPTSAVVAIARRETWSRYSNKHFRIRGGQIEFFPTPTENITVSLRYVPAFVDLVDDVDTYDGVNGWEKLVTLGAAIEMKLVENLPADALMRERDMQRARIAAMVQERQAITPGQIRDVERNGYGGWPTRRGRAW